MTTPTSTPDPAASADLAPKYAPLEVEREVAARWTAANAFHAEPTDPGKPYAIVIPPPNVTAALHMGHALNNTLQDILIRYHRMLGDNTMWMPGTDHAGIATQTIVEKRVLESEGKRRTDFQRDEFIGKIQAWKDEYEAFITNQLKMMGCSCDWDRQRFTMDEVCAKSVREAFFQLFKDGLIYRGKRLVNWDPVTLTALADDEVEMEEVDGFFYYLKYEVVSGTGTSVPVPSEPPTYITVATTRPETMLGDTAVAINPKDPRAAALRGKFVRLPIVNRIIPIIEDDYVVLPIAHGGDPADTKAQFATGFLKVTPAHDPNDYDIGRRHNLPVINVMAPDASISKDHGWPAEEWTSTPQAGPASAGPRTPLVSDFTHTLLGKSREQARKLIVDWFKQNNLLEDQKPYQHSVGHSYRSHVPIEPYLSDQWYVKVTDDKLRGAALRAMARDQFDDSAPAAKAHGLPSVGFREPAQRYENQLRFYPQRYAKTFQHWHENIRDWCISRQLWWGHRIPVWSFNPIGDDPDVLKEPKGYRDQLEKSLNEYARLFDLVDPFSVTVDLDRWQFFICCRNENADFLIERIEENRVVAQFRRIGEGSITSKIPAGETAERRHAAWKVTDLADEFVRDPDVLDTWFSSGLWPISTLGWPDANAALEKWNPSNTLCTAREIITLWVSRMVMFNVYFRGCLPFTDVFIHAMIQDGHGQKMSKSLGNGVDPLDIIHSHGSDAMRFTLASMTTATQDVRMTVEMVCPHTQQSFTPKFIKDKAGYMVAAPIQECPTDSTKKIVSSYGNASGKAKPTAEMPVARNTSEKFDFGRNFANKLWNAVRFALSYVKPSESDHWTMPSIVDQWILARLARTVETTTKALEAYEFKVYADTLYDFIWRDFCDWYIEAIKPTVGANEGQQRVLVTVIDVILRLLHPAMPFITEKLWERLNVVAPKRTDLTMDGLFTLTIPMKPLLVKTPWPKAKHNAEGAAKVEARFEAVRQIVSALREVRTSYKVVPKQKVDCTIKTPGPVSETLREDANLIATLANVQITAMGSTQTRSEDAAATTVGDLEIFLAGLINKDAEKARLTKFINEMEKSIASMTTRLSNKAYTDKAPPALVQESRDKLAALERELAALKAQLAALG